MTLIATNAIPIRDETPNVSLGNSHMETGLANDLCVFSLRHPDGRRTCPAYVCYGERFAQASIAEAYAYFSRIAEKTGASLDDTIVVTSLLDAGTDHQHSMKWSELRHNLNLDFLADLARRSVSPSTTAILAENLAVEQNRDTLVALVQDSDFTPLERNEILAAMDVALAAHEGVPAAREQDQEGLFHIPYSNHCVCIAINAIKLGFSAQAVQALLMHDVKEDTLYPMNLISARFKPGVVQMIEYWSKPPEQTREAFMLHISTLTGEIQAGKGLDRFDNTIRAFAIRDVGYLNRLLAENRGVYNRFFLENPLLVPLKDTFFSLQRDLENQAKTL